MAGKMLDKIMISHIYGNVAFSLPYQCLSMASDTMTRLMAGLKMQRTIRYPNSEMLWILFRPEITAFRARC